LALGLKPLGGQVDLTEGDLHLRRSRLLGKGRRKRGKGIVVP